MADPYDVLGVAPSASLAELGAARRRLAIRAHPDHGGDGVRMREINAAYQEAVSRLTDPPAPTATATPAPDPPPRPPDEPVALRWMEHDESSFVVHALPAEAFEVLLEAAAHLGEVVDDDPPYLLDVMLRAPQWCLCRLQLVPDAGASTVSLSLAMPADPVAGRRSLDSVRDAWVAAINGEA